VRLWRSVFATAAAIHPTFQRNTLAECHRPGSVGSATGRGPAFVFKVETAATSTVACFHALYRAWLHG